MNIYEAKANAGEYIVKVVQTNMIHFLNVRLSLSLANPISRRNFKVPSMMDASVSLGPNLKAIRRMQMNQR